MSVRMRAGEKGREERPSLSREYRGVASSRTRDKQAQVNTVPFVASSSRHAATTSALCFNIFNYCARHHRRISHIVTNG